MTARPARATGSDEPQLPAIQRPTSLTRDADGLAETARRLSVIDTPQEADAAGQFLRGVRTRIRAIKAHYKNVRAPIRRALADVSEMEAADLAPWESADLLLANRLKVFLVEERRRTEAENRARLEAAEEEAREAQRRAAETLRRAAETAQTDRDRKALERQARQVERSAPLPVVTGMVEAPKVDGISTPTQLVCEVRNMKELCRAVLAGKVPEAALLPNQAWLDEQAGARGKDLGFPGCVVVEKVSLAARGVR